MKTKTLVGIEKNMLSDREFVKKVISLASLSKVEIKEKKDEWDAINMKTSGFCPSLRTKYEDDLFIQF